MKKSILVGLVIVILLSLSACGVSTYTITTRNEKEYISKGEPEFDDKNEWVIFTTTADKKVKLRESEVLTISEN